MINSAHKYIVPFLLLILVSCQFKDVKKAYGKTEFRQKHKAYKDAKKKPLIHLVAIWGEKGNGLVTLNEIPLCWELFKAQLQPYNIQLDSFVDSYEIRRRKIYYKDQMDEFIRHDFGESFLSEQLHQANCLCIEDTSLIFDERLLENYTYNLKFNPIDLGSKRINIKHISNPQLRFFQEAYLFKRPLGQLDISVIVKPSGQLKDLVIDVQTVEGGDLDNTEIQLLTDLVKKTLIDSSEQMIGTYFGTPVQVKREFQLFFGQLE